MNVRKRDWSFLPLVILGGLILMATASQRVLKAASDWPEEMEVIQIPSSIDGATQPAYFYASHGKIPRPLVVSLHTWSGDYSQQDTLAVLALQQNWNYIHPNFRGPNRTPAACLSDTALQDIDDAIDFAFMHARCDSDNIFVIGVSGGGYATLGMYMRSKHYIKAFSAWASISDLEAWYYESQVRQNKYASDILGCLGLEGRFDPGAARARSPLYWKTPHRNGSRLDIHAGVNDGYTGSVPITHSLFFYNKVCRDLGCTDQKHLVDPKTILWLLKYRRLPSPKDFGKIGERRIIYHNSWKNISVTIFDGTHEMLPMAAFQSLVEQAGETMRDSR